VKDLSQARWLSSGDPNRLYWPIAIADRVSERKAALYVVACVLSTPLAEPPAILKRAIAVVEATAEGGGQRRIRSLERAADRAIEQAVDQAGLDTAPHFLALAALRMAERPLAGHAVQVPYFLAEAVRELQGSQAADRLRRLYADLLRDVIGNPFKKIVTKAARRGRPYRTRVFFNAAWRTPAVVGLADAIYDEQSFGLLPILADALEDAGCDQPDLVEHCRSGGIHARGCWMVDLLLGRS
jgi:hypothetical protein